MFLGRTNTTVVLWMIAEGYQGTVILPFAVGFAVYIEHVVKRKNLQTNCGAI